MRYNRGVIPKVPWLPATVQPEQPMERCPACGARRLFPWTLRRDLRQMTVLRTWLCTACQHTEEREEVETSAGP
jgi:DNA-directed RNA polymerase subunit M/transcription elongation factor TFIIS